MYDQLCGWFLQNDRLAKSDRILFTREQVVEMIRYAAKHEKREAERFPFESLDEYESRRNERND